MILLVNVYGPFFRLLDPRGFSWNSCMAPWALCLVVYRWILPLCYSECAGVTHTSQFFLFSLAISLFIIGGGRSAPYVFVLVFTNTLIFLVCYYVPFWT